MCFLLFLNTLHVEAAYNNFTWTRTFNVHASGSWGSTITGGTSSSYTASSNAVGSYHVTIPFIMYISSSNVPDVTLSANTYYGVTFGSWSFSYTGVDYCENVGLYNSEGDLIAVPYTGTNNTGNFWANQFYVRNGNLYDGQLAIPLVLEFDCCWTDSATYDTSNVSNLFQSVNVTNSIYVNFTNVSNAQVSSSSVVVSDLEANESLNNIESSNSQIASSVTSETGTGLLATIKNFFGSFFSNIIDSFKSLFIPDDEYFSDWFDDMNDLLSEKLGILYYPFDLLVSFFSRLTSALSTTGSSADSSIVFPAIVLPMNGTNYTILERTTINLSDYVISFSSSDNSSLVGTAAFANLASIIRTFNSFVIVLCLLSLLRKKLNLILRGDDYDS